jgi:hypothetical protein
MTPAFNKVQQLWNKGLRKKYKGEEAVEYLDKFIFALEELAEELPAYRHELKIVRKEILNKLKEDLPMPDVAHDNYL